MARTFFGLTLAAALLGLIGCSQAADADDEVAEDAQEIVGGTVAKANAWPGAVAVYYGSMQGCGGSLVSDSWVVTAAHCIDTAEPLGGITKVVIGRHRLSTAIGETRVVDRVVTHEGFDDNLNDDIALLHLSAPSTLPTAQLVSPSQTGAAAAGASVTVVGWGDTKEDGRASDVLRQVALPVISNAKCITYSEYEGVTAKQICAAKAGKDSCQGDSGGPLFQTIGGRKVQVGLVSWGIGCARPNAPGVYTRLASYLDWMRTHSDGEIGASAAAR